MSFCFRLNMFASKFVNLDIPCFSLLLLVAFVLKHNVDEKTIEKYWNINVRICVKLELQEVGSWFNICHDTIIRSYCSSMHLLCGFNGQLRYYCESFILDSPPKIDPSKNCWTHAKNIDPRKDKGKKFWTHAKKVWPTQKYI